MENEKCHVTCGGVGRGAPSQCHQMAHGVGGLKYFTKNLVFGVHFNIFDHINGMLLNYCRYAFWAKTYNFTLFFAV
jgi:hypothetical protein